MLTRAFGRIPRGAWRISALGVVLAVVATACGSGSGGGGVAGASDGGVRYPDGSQFSPEAKNQSGLASLQVGVNQVTNGSVLPVGHRPRRGLAAALCRPDGTIDTGPFVHPAWAPPCVASFTGKNGGATARGVTADTIRLAYYVTVDPTLRTANQQAGGCGSLACTQDYVSAYVDWFSSYYQLYGRRIEIQLVHGSGGDDDGQAAVKDADTIAGFNPPVFAALNGPKETGAAYATELAKKGVMCFCTISLPQQFYASHAPYVWSWYMASTQAYVHRADYIGRRLAGRPAVWAGSAAMRARRRSFGLVWFDDALGSYGPGVDSFKTQLAKYGVRLATTIRYVGVTGCQTNATQIVLQLIQSGVTSVMFAGDPVCPIALTKAAAAAAAAWEWIVSGSYLTDTNVFARLYDQTQWSRAFGVSLEAPLAATGDWYRIYKEVRPGGTPKIDAIDALRQLILFTTGVHMAGPKLTPSTFRAGMARTRPTGGTVTVPRISYGPKVVEGMSMWDYTATDDMTEVWWDATAYTELGGYRYVAGGRRYRWGQWPSSAPNVFETAGTVLEYGAAPDQ